MSFTWEDGRENTFNQCTSKLNVRNQHVCNMYFEQDINVKGNRNSMSLTR